MDILNTFVELNVRWNSHITGLFWYQCCLATYVRAPLIHRVRLREAVMKKDVKICHATIKKTIQLMTLGIDVSDICPEIIMVFILFLSILSYYHFCYFFDQLCVVLYLNPCSWEII